MEEETNGGESFSPPLLLVFSNASVLSTAKRQSDLSEEGGGGTVEWGGNRMNGKRGWLAAFVRPA